MTRSTDESLSPLKRSQANLKSLLWEGMVVWGLFALMLIITGGHPPNLIILVTFVVSGIVVFRAESKRERALAQKYSQTQEESGENVSTLEASQASTSSLPSKPEPNRKLSSEGKTLLLELPEGKSPAQPTFSLENPPVCYLQKGQIDNWNKWKSVILSAESTHPQLEDPISSLRISVRKALTTSERISFYKVNLSQVDLCYLHFTDTDFRFADLSNAKLFGTQLERANFRGANLQGADLREADLDNAQFEGVASARDALFSSSVKLSEDTKIALKAKGAIFQDPLDMGSVVGGMKDPNPSGSSEMLDLVEEGECLEDSM